MEYSTYLYDIIVCGDIMYNLNVPEHIAIIMDGNGRWAQKRGFERTTGHVKGAETLAKIVNSSSNLGVKYLTVYAFSTENWSRPKEEIDTLMSLTIEYFNKYKNEYVENNIKVKFIGKRDNFTEEIMDIINHIEKETEKCDGLNFIVAVDYGSQDEIIDAINKIKEFPITKEKFKDYLYTKDIPQVDLLIRTSGEKRLSNFLLWQVAYAEFVFYEKYWPDFKEKDLLKCIKIYNKRDRRFGGLK